MKPINKFGGVQQSTLHNNAIPVSGSYAPQYSRALNGFNPPVVYGNYGNFAAVGTANSQQYISNMPYSSNTNYANYGATPNYSAYPGYPVAYPNMYYPRPYGYGQNYNYNMPVQTPYSPSSSVRYGGAIHPLSPPTPSLRTYYCEPCDKEFNNKGNYDAHIGTHEKCSHPNCTFSATKKVVSAHFHSTHGAYCSQSGYKNIEVEGQTFRVLMGTNAKEVEEWRAARRKKYPTEGNIKAKESADEELDRAGGITNSKKRKLDDSGNRKNRPCLKFAKGACSNEDCTYSHDLEQFQHLVCRNFRKNKCKSGDRCKFLHMGPQVNDSSVNEICSVCDENTSNVLDPAPAANPVDNDLLNSNSNKKIKKQGLILPKPLDGYDGRGSLLRKLLSKEIDSEESKILQCLRYINMKNFFQDTLTEDSQKEENI